MIIFLPNFNEPTETKRSLNEDTREVQEAVLRQASDIATPIYHQWKSQLKDVGLTWQAFQSAASMNQGAWRNWLNGEISWHRTLEQLVEQLNGKITGITFELGE